MKYKTKKKIKEKMEHFRLSKKQIIAICVAAAVCIIAVVTAVCVHASNKSKQETTTEATTIETTTEATTEPTTEETTEETTEATTEATTVSTTAKPTTTTKPESSYTYNGDWKLILVNPWNKMPSGYTSSISLTQLKNGQSVDSRCYPDLQEMMDDCRAAGYDPVICSSFRSYDTQEYLYNIKVNQFKYEGYSDADARVEAGKIVAVPGTSEHQLGLAVDIVDTGYQVLDEGQENRPTQKWLMANSYKYGWILRYPSSKSSITGIIYEPWHYRYVGKEAAAEIYSRGICLEEYLK